MKIIATISDTTDAVFQFGAKMGHLSYEINIPDELVNDKILEFIEVKKNNKIIDTIFFSLLDE